MDDLRPKKVSEKRWKAAQVWEAGFWAIHESRSPKKSLKHRITRLLRLRPENPGDANNNWWKNCFDDYSFLPRAIQAAIEVGCGPYTNIRLIMEGRKINKIVCSDPLGKTYLTFRKRWLSTAVRKGIVDLRSPAESLPFPDNSFDLVILINVLDHVQDAEACVKSVKRITKHGGFLIVGQDLTDDEDRIRMEGDEMNLTGHPIFLTHTELDEMLPTEEFERVFMKILTREEGLCPQTHYGTYLLAGRKL